jgi:hypothetical protein
MLFSNSVVNLRQNYFEILIRNFTVIVIPENPTKMIFLKSHVKLINSYFIVIMIRIQYFICCIYIMISIQLLLSSMTTTTTTTTTTIYCEAINFINYIKFKIRNNINIVEKKLKFNFISRYHETMIDDKYNYDNVDEEEDDDDDDSHFLSNVEKDNKDALYTLFYLVNSTDGWYNIGTRKGVTVERRYLTPSGSFVSKADASKGFKHACVKSTAILDVSPDHVFNLLADSKRAREYNDHIKTNRDVIHLPAQSNNNNNNFSHWTKCTWAATAKNGIFKPRDFLTVAHFTRYDNGTSIMLNRPAYLKSHQPTDKYVRATVLLAGNIIRPHGLYGNQTHLTMLAQINPGGISDTPAAAWIINKLCASGPPSFIRQLEHAAQKTKLSISTSKRSRLLSPLSSSSSSSSSFISTALNNIFQTNFQQSNNQFRKFLLSSMERVKAEVPYNFDPKSFLHSPWLIQSMRMYNF